MLCIALSQILSLDDPDKDPDGVGGQEPESQHEGNSLAGKTRQYGMYWAPIVGPGLSAMCWTELTLKGSPPPTAMWKCQVAYNIEMTKA